MKKISVHLEVTSISNVLSYHMKRIVTLLDPEEMVRVIWVKKT